MSSGFHVPKEHIDTLICAALYWWDGKFFYPALGRCSLVDDPVRLTPAWWFMHHLTHSAIRRLPGYRPPWYGYPIEDH